MTDWTKFQPRVPVRAAARAVRRGEPETALVRRLESKYGGAGMAFILLDCSSSMDRSRKLRLAKSGASEFADSAISKGYEVGLIQFADEAWTAAPPSADAARLRRAAADACARGSTNMADAFSRAGQDFDHDRAARALVLVTDGMPDDPPAALAAADRLKQRGVEIITVGTEDADHTFLEKLATRSDLATVVQAASLDRAIADRSRLLPSTNGTVDPV